MRRLHKLKESEIPSAEKLLRRVEAALQEEKLYFPVPTLEKLIDQNCCYLDKEGVRPLGLAVIRHELVPYFVPNEKEASLLQEKTNLQEEQVNVITLFAVDPAFWGKGVGQELFSYLESNYRHGSWLIKIEKRNTRALSFFGKLDFLPFEEKGNRIHLIRRLKREGLASWDF